MSTQALSARLLEERQALFAQITVQRDQLQRLEGIVVSLQECLAHDEHLLDELDGVLGTASQLRIESLDPRLYGRRLEEVAIEVLREDLGPSVEIHYRDWFELLRARGHRIRGKEPLGTFLAQIGRSTAIERVGRRTGRYRLVSAHAAA